MQPLPGRRGLCPSNRALQERSQSFSERPVACGGRPGGHLHSTPGRPTHCQGPCGPKTVWDRAWNRTSQPSLVRPARSFSGPSAPAGSDAGPRDREGRIELLRPPHGRDCPGGAHRASVAARTASGDHPNPSESFHGVTLSPPACFSPNARNGFWFYRAAERTGDRRLDQIATAAPASHASGSSTGRGHWTEKGKLNSALTNKAAAARPITRVMIATMFSQLLSAVGNASFHAPASIGRSIS